MQASEQIFELGKKQIIVDSEKRMRVTLGGCSSLRQRVWGETGAGLVWAIMDAALSAGQ